MSEGKLVSIDIDIPDDLWEEILKISAEMGISAQEFIVRAIEAYLDQHAYPDSEP